jgi:hypothetical protein
MRYRAYVVSMLLAAVLATFGQGSRPPGFGLSYARPVPAPVLATVRECLAAIDQFIVDGDLDALWQSLDQLGHGLDPWPQTDYAQRDVAALAFRSTFPAVQLALASIEPSENLYAVRLQASIVEGVWPSWLGSTTGPSLPSLDLLVEFDLLGLVQRAGTASFTDPLVYTVSDPGTPFLLPDRARFVAARISLTSSEHGVRYLTVGAPGLVIPETGTLLVEGEGRLLTLVEGGSRWSQIVPGESTEIAPGDLLYLASGYAVLTMTSARPAHLMYAALVTLAPRSAPEVERGRAVPVDLGQMVASISGTPTATWFGAIESVTSSKSFTPSGLTTLEMAWLMLPPGSEVAIAPKTSFVAFGYSDIATIAERQSGEAVIANATNHPLTVLVLSSGSR